MNIISEEYIAPEDNLAFDEFLLDKAERGEIGETIRFWECPEYFVVLGRSCKVEEDCMVDAIREDNIKILRRISGGGTVLQGPGSLNYSLILSYDSSPEYRDIRSSYNAVLGAIASTMKKRGIQAEVLPLSDLAVGGRKFSGNAQARKKNYFLHHGTLLFDMDLDKVSQYLKHPPKEPEYRNGRVHSDFITNILLAKDELKQMLLDVFAAGATEYVFSEQDGQEIRRLVGDRYSQDTWNLQF